MSDRPDEGVSIDDLADTLQDILADDLEINEDESERLEGEEEAPEADEGQESDADVKIRLKIKSEGGTESEEELTPKEIAEAVEISRDYHKKRQVEANEVRKAQQQYYGAVEQNTKQTVEVIDQLKAFVLQSVAPDLQNLTPQLAMSDPAEYVRLDAAYKQTQQTLAQLDAHRNEVEAQQKQAETEAYQYARAGILTAANEYLGKVAPETLKSDYRDKALAFVYKTYGISQNDAAFLADAPEFKQGGVFDSGKFVHILNDAMKYHALQANKPIQMNKVAQAPKTMKPQSRPAIAKNEKLASRLQKYGRAEDLAAFL